MGLLARFNQPTSRSIKPYLGVMTVVAAASSAPIAIRFAQAEGIPSLTLILIRLWLTSIGLAPWVLWKYREQFARLTKEDWGWMLLAGVVHALNLSLLFFSLEFTSVLVSTVLRQTSPLWVLFMEIIFLHAAFSGRIWVAVIVTVTGAVLVGFGGAGGLDAGTHPAIGGGLAFLNAIMNGVYLLIGRRTRNRIGFLPYSWFVFTCAAVVISVVVSLTRAPVLGFSPAGYAWAVAVTLIAQVFGHIPINAVLRHFPATLLSLSLQISVVAAAVLAYFTLGEVPALLQIVGSALILGGVVLALWARPA
jgi:drug/metabolite transporter (DMT)-like permease